ncbi:hypothetical protein LSTR_LSTR006481 [Laodelphax striatellus]|uniref:Ion transport domain-containing protein n=1 Tax=Laodelphax striatellus TaxID=195883 RepID=A0A482WXP7_LAOST|nr:hypothetical protein LSTR_LSTR006481 [Laodelphax striatellus]
MALSENSRKVQTPDGYVRFSNDIANGLDSLHQRSINNSDDIPNEIGSRSSLNRDVELRSPSEITSDTDFNWQMNYHEAAIFLEEGENNEKFDSHPCHPEALPAYLLVHNRLYYTVDLVTSIILLALALGEDPAVPAFKLPVWVHSTIELFCLFIIGLELGFKLRWIGWATILKHKRTMLKCITLVIMVLEALVILVRQSSHLRVTRALRPIFLVDTCHLGGVRRCIRQILQSLPPILDMLALIFFFVSVYALLGYHLFSENHVNKSFQTLYDSFVTMFVLLTTANFPDVMMPAYAISKWYSVFFISYLCICLYILMNLMLAVVYETFTSIEREKFKKLLLHKQQACHHAFRLLVTKQHPGELRFRQFEGLMRYYKPKKSVRDTLLIFKQLNTSNSGFLKIDEFCNIYDAVTLQWEAQYSNIPWYHGTWIPERLQTVCQLTHTIVSEKYFEHAVTFIILTNCLAMIFRATQNYSNLEEAAHVFISSWDAVFFMFCYVTEASLKILGLGVHQYLNSGWNCYDITVTTLTVASIILIKMFPSWTFLVIFRPLRMLRLFKSKKRYRDIIGTMALLVPLMCSTAVVMLVLYYFFAIIGMELFAGYDMRNCCIGTAVEEFYRASNVSGNATSAIGYYYLNTFENLAASTVTLFELTVVNNWFILMDGYAYVFHPLSRFYFILFYLFTMIVLTIVVASVLEAFRFRIQYKRQTTKRDEEKLLHEEVHLRWDEVESWIPDFLMLEKLKSDFVVNGTATYLGCRPRNREVLQKRMYRNEMEEWLRENAINGEQN